jgi:ADP-ribose pyrophosphatase YjhB (NUDIX family)
MWELPGGSVDPGESLKEGAVRELFEESGIMIRPSGLLPLTHFEFHNAETGVRKVKFAFDARVEESPHMHISPDHAEARFMSRAEIEELSREGRDTPYVLWADHYTILMA